MKAIEAVTLYRKQIHLSGRVQYRFCKDANHHVYKIRIAFLYHICSFVVGYDPTKEIVLSVCFSCHCFYWNAWALFVHTGNL